MYLRDGVRRIQIWNDQHSLAGHYAFVLDMVERRTLRKAEFTETSDGHCPSARAAHPRAGRDHAAVGQVARPDPIAEHVAHVFGKAIAGTYSAASLANVDHAETCSVRFPRR
jgi:hypothetical protein